MIAMNFENEHLTRQMDIIPMAILEEEITIIGAGAIGSWTALALAKMGFSKISIWDHDTVDIENMNSQIYSYTDIGRPKVYSLAGQIKLQTDIDVKINHAAYELGFFNGIVICAVDSMKIRKQLWNEHKERAVNCKAIIDARMGAETALLFSMNPMNLKDCEDYAATLYTDESAVQERCTAKATVYTALMLSGLVVKAVKDRLINPEKYLRTVQWSIKDNDFVGFNC